MTKMRGKGTLNTNVCFDFTVSDFCGPCAESNQTWHGQINSLRCSGWKRSCRICFNRVLFNVGIAQEKHENKVR